MFQAVAVFTSVRWSTAPDTGKALVTNLATACMLMMPRHRDVRLDRKTVSSSLLTVWLQQNTRGEARNKKKKQQVTQIIVYLPD